MEKNNNEKQRDPEQGPAPSFEEYFSMNEQEKDRAVEQSVLRLQNRIRQVLYLLEIERNPSVKPSSAAHPSRRSHRGQ
jgi:hypothetical protein